MAAHHRRRALLVVAALGVTAAMLSARPAPATVAEQRARLPPPAECDDPVVGTWRAHKFADGIWEEFKLEIRRVAGDESKLEGVIENHYWNGDKTREQPGPCDAIQQFRVRIRMPAEGSVTGQQISFRGTSWTREEQYCGSPHGYNLDHFTGTIDSAIQEFQSVNNDGGRYVNEPTVFRRVECREGGADDEAPAPRIEVKPPPLFPENSSCHCSVVGG